MGDVVGLEQHPVVGQAGQFCQDALRIPCGVGISIDGEFLAARGEAHAEIFFDQLEVPIVVAEQNGSVGAFSQFKFTHADAGDRLLAINISNT